MTLNGTQLYPNCTGIRRDRMLCFAGKPWKFPVASRAHGGEGGQMPAARSISREIPPA